MELKDTIDLMCSGDYKERFKGEYLQLKIRAEKLEKFIRKPDVTPTCSMELLKRQSEVMNCLLTILEYRAAEENINVKELL